MPDDPPPPSDADLQRFANITEQNIRAVLLALIDTTVPKNAHAGLLVAFSVAAVYTAADMFRGITKAEKVPEAEDIAIAYVRAAFRGSELPLNDDGSPHRSAGRRLN